MPNVFLVLEISMRNKMGSSISAEAVDQKISVFHHTMPYTLFYKKWFIRKYYYIDQNPKKIKKVLALAPKT